MSLKLGPFGHEQNGKILVLALWKAKGKMYSFIFIYGYTCVSVWVYT